MVTPVVTRFTKGSPIGEIDADLVPGIPAALQSLEAIMSGRLGYTWRFGIKRSQDFNAADFVHLMESASSEFPELTAPAFAHAETYFGGVAIPLRAPEAFVERNIGFSSDILAYNYRRREQPLYINDEPHKVYIGRFHLFTGDSEREYLLKPRLRLSRYSRYIVATTGSDFPDDVGEWNESHSPVLSLGDFGGEDQYVHIAVPHGTAPTPTYVAIAEDGSANIASSFAAPVLGTLLMAGNVPYAVYSSGAALAAATYSGRDIVVLPERSGIEYYEAPTAIADEALSFTWYGGFYSWARSGSHPSEPVTESFINAGAGVASSAMRQLVMPDDGDGDPYRPNADNYYVRFVAWPAGQTAISGLYSVPAITYVPLADIMTGAANWWTNSWTEQPNNPVSIGGVDYNVFLNRRSTNHWSSSPRSGERFHAFTG